MLFQFSPQCLTRGRRSRRFGHHDNIPTADVALVEAKAFPDDALDSVARHGSRCGFFRDGQAQTWIAQAIGCSQQGECPTRCTPRLGKYTPELYGPGQPRAARKAGRTPFQGVENYTVRRARPLARRALMTKRPFLVRIRARKPWVRLRCRLLGWNVLFMTVTHCLVAVLDAQQ